MYIIIEEIEVNIVNIKIEALMSIMPKSTNSKHKPIILHPSDQVFICSKIENVFNF